MQDYKARTETVVADKMWFYHFCWINVLPFLFFIFISFASPLFVTVSLFYLGIIPRARVGYEMIDSPRGA